jgi:hypothetical protein
MLLSHPAAPRSELERGSRERSSHERDCLGRDSTADGDRKIIRFPAPGGVRRGESVRWDAMGGSPVAGLEKYEHGPQGNDDYRGRMFANLLAAVVLVALIVTGSWIVETIAQAGRL